MAETQEVSVRLAAGHDNALSFKGTGLFAPKADAAIKIVGCRQIPYQLLEHVDALVHEEKWAGVTDKTHVAWANAPRHKGWFRKGEEQHFKSKMVQASAAIGADNPGVVTVVVTRPEAKVALDNWVFVFVAERQ